MKKRIKDCKKCRKRRISIVVMPNGKKMVKSFELYNAVGMRKNHYTRWMIDTVLPLGCVHKDYSPAQNNISKRTKVIKRKKLRYFLKIDFAISVCLLMRRKKSIEVRNFLIQER